MSDRLRLTTPLPSLDAWVDAFARAEIPVLAETAESLEHMRATEDDVDAHGLGEMIATDPLMTLKVLAHASEQRRGRSSGLRADAETVTAAIVLMGITPFFRDFGPQPTLEAVLADGSVWSALTPLRKDNRGFDLKQLLIGSEGTLGIITAATLRLVPAVAERIVIWAGVGSIHDARALLLHGEERLGAEMEGFEVMPEATLGAVLDYLPDARAPLEGGHPWHVLIEVVADRAGAAGLRERTETALAEAFAGGLVRDAVLSASEAQAETFWMLRESVAPAERAKGPAVQHDISVPVERMPDFIEEAVATMEQRHPGTEAVAFGHLGDGNVHLHVIAPKGAVPGVWQEAEGKAISAEVYDMVAAWGGSISAEHGIGQAKLEELERLGDPVSLSLLRQVKAALDPQGILNPGKLVRLAPSRATA